MAIPVNQIYSLVRNGLSIIKKIRAEPSKVEVEISKLSRKIDIRLDVIERKIDDSVSRQIVSAFVCIADAIGTRNRTEYMNLMGLAHKSFTEISCIQSNGTTYIQGKSLPNSFVAGMGFYGRYLYFALVDRPEDALRQVYNCSSMYPEAGVLFFDRCFFSDNYHDKLLELNNRISKHFIEDMGNLDEDGVVLSFEKEDLLDLIKDECSSIQKELRSGNCI